MRSPPSGLHPRLRLVYAIFSALLLGSGLHSAHCFSHTPGEKSPWTATDEVLPPAYYRQVYVDAAVALPWDVGGPQPTVIRQAKAGSFAGKSVLDCGCGLGENARLLGDVGRAAHVTGFDISPAAISRAREGTNETSVSFRVADCTNLRAAFPRETFDVAVDSACLHCLSDSDAATYAAALQDLVTERLFVGCFSAANGASGWSNPRRLSRGDLARYFDEDHWDIRSIEDVWWSRPGARGSRQGGFCPGLWMEAVRKH